MRPVAVMGAGGHARVISSIIKANQMEITGFFDDSCGNNQELIHGAPVLGPFKDIVQYGKSLQAVYLALGSNSQRRKWYSFLAKNNFNLPALFHPFAQMEKDVAIGMATVVCIGAIVCTQVDVGQGCIINTGCCIDHESSVGNFSHLAPGVTVAGRTHIGNNTFVGLNTAIADGIKVGNNVVIGAGSVVLADIPDGSRVVGVYK
jgi:sugar O-acyltransferase (sialic acid O-acetyltransferase NeuD family)